MISLMVTVLLGLLLKSNPANEDSGDSLGLTFVTIPAGSFMMGSPETELGRRDNEGPQHIVTIDYSFEMMTTEVTADMWFNVTGQSWQGVIPGLPGVGSYPVAWISVAPYGWKGFIHRLNSVDSLYLYRLPTESEWEYACRAGTSTRFYWGDEADTRQITVFSWCADNTKDSLYGIHPVAQLQPNAWGLYDMCGNVSELCQDLYNASYESAPTDGSAQLEGTDLSLDIWDRSDSRPALCDYTVRGGCSLAAASDCRSASRRFRIGADWLVGLRLVRTLR